MKIFMIIFLFLSLLGYGITVHKKLGIKKEFIPIFVFSIIILLMFFAGLLNILPHMAWVIFIGGVILFSFCMVQIEAAAFKQYLRYFYSPEFLIILAIGIFFLIQVQNVRLIHYDNFTHWMMIIKEMELTNRLPTYLSINVGAASYPPGSALFIYFINYFSGYSELNALIAQFVLILSCLYCLFAFSKPGNDNDKKSRQIKYFVTMAILILGSIYLLNGPSPIFDLVVDTVLTLFSLAGLLIIIFYRDNIFKAAIITMPIMATLILLKNSGMFFWLIGLLYWLYLYRGSQKKLNRNAKVIALAVIVAFPLLCSFLWSRHLDLVFPSGNIGDHAMNAENYKDTFLGKSESEVKSITAAFIDRTVDLKRTIQIRNYLIWNIGLVGIWFLLFLLKHKDKYLLKAIGFANLVLVSYILGLYFMYLLSFRTEEALALAGYGRYINMITLYLEGYYIIQLVLLVNRSKEINKLILNSLCALLGILAAVTVYHKGIIDSLSKPPYIDTRRYKAETAMEDYNPDASYFIYTSGDFNEDKYLNYLLRYLYWARNYTYRDNIETAEEFLSSVVQADYFVVINEDELVIELLRPYIEKENYHGTYLSSIFNGETPK
ncbi:MAG: hypothetical protein FWG91_07620 [Lachnospiraceae bacterium]|nr:hypothetical protein [Lachnospiraceae bacterium]